MAKGSYHLRREQFIPRHLAEVFPFFADAGNLEAITPPWLNFRIISPQPIVVQSGTVIDYRLALFGVPLSWQTRIEAFEPPVRFIDRQVWGPYRLWHHTHEFREQDGGTGMTDRVDYKLYLGPIGWAANAVMVRRMLDQIFDYRYEAIDRLLGARSPDADASRSPSHSKPLGAHSVT